MIDVYQTVTDRIIASLEAGRIPWKQTWKADASLNVPSNFVSKKSYRGINIWLLMCSEYPSNQWLTYKQAQQIGAQVRKGEKGSQIVFWKFGDEKDEDTGKRSSWAMMRQYTVFNIAQCDGIPQILPFEAPNTFEPIEAAELAARTYLESGNAPTLVHEGDRAFYRPSADSVTMPAPSSFFSPEAYYSTLFHELGHSTMHPARCDRKEAAANHFGDHLYSKEELVAEFTAAFMCAHAGISNAALETNTVAYIQSWLSKLRNDKKLAVSAAQKAQKAADFMLLRSAAQLEDEAVAA
ncbi:MAG TPA: zincin-like metallopeptidase domain-containing protein [Terracidiphilus sp.]|jgi:antirestriction protein ArdC|nr:zincin-like metallopeptidase domain-containing protein [Terracidiphilus sp.]